MATHTCVFFEDRDLDLLCICGARAIHVLEADGESTVLVVLDEDATVTTMPSAPVRAGTLVFAATA